MVKVKDGECVAVGLGAIVGAAIVGGGATVIA